MQTTHLSMRRQTLDFDLHLSDSTKGICYHFCLEFSLKGKIDVLEVAAAANTLTEVVTWSFSSMRRGREYFDHLCPCDLLLHLGHFRDYSLPFDRTAYKYRQTLSMGDEVATMRDALDIESEKVSNRYRIP